MSIVSRSVSVCAAFAVVLLSLIPSAAAAQTSSISGTVTDAGGTPLANVPLTVLTANNQWVASVGTALNGSYTISGLTDGGTYYVATNNGLGFIDEVWNNVRCTGCFIPGSGTGIVAAGAVSNINFALDLGARFSGTVTDGTNPIGGVSISLFDADGQYAGYGYTAMDGTFTTTAVGAGSYRFHTYNTAGFIDQAYGGIICTSCPGTTGTQVASGAPGSIAGGVNFTLNPGKQFSGQMTDSLGNPIQAWPQVYDASGNYVAGGSLDGNGNYITQALPAGSYRIRTWNNLGYINEVYNNFQCVGCFATGPLTATGAGQVTPGIDFSLDLGGTISATITSDGGAPLANINLQIFNAAGVVVLGSSTDASGVTQGVEGLPSGTYYARTYNNIGYLDEIYDGIQCPTCTIPGAGTPIAVVQGSATNISIGLTLGARLTGVVTGVGGAPLANVNLTVYTAAGQFAGGSFTAADGSYSTAGLVAGSYLIRTSPTPGYVAQAYDGITCMSCPPTTGTLITLAASELRTGINFALVQSGSIQGTVTGTGGAPLSGVSILIYDTSGTQVPGTSTLANGTFMQSGLLPGTYFVRTSNSQGYFDQLHSGISCASGCVVTTGTQVIVTAGGSTPVNFALIAGGRIAGTITGTGGVPLQNVNVQIYTSAGMFATSTNTNASGGYLTNALTAGNYFARTFNSQGYVEQLYNGFVCAPGCTITSGTQIPVSNGNNSTANFALTEGATITGTILNSAGGVAQGVSMQIYSSAGSFVMQSTQSNASGVFTMGGVVPGNYYLRTTNNAGFVDKLYNTATVCFPFCTVTTGTLTALNTGSNTVNMTLDPGGRISGRVTDNSTGLGISGVSVSAALSPSTVTSFLGSTDANGNFSSSLNLPAGTFRLRTSNGSGYVDEVHNNIVCAPSCTISSGTGVAVSAGATTTVDFGLDKGVRFTGTITGPAPGLVSAQVFTAAGTLVTSWGVNASGVYTTGAVPVGTYFIRTSNSANFIDQLHSGITCTPTCTVTTGTALSPAAGSLTTVNFALVAGGQITGNVSGPGGGAGGLTVEAYSATGTFMRSAVTSTVAGSVGNYAIGGLATGNYLLRTRNSVGLLDEVYTSPDSNSICIGCSILTVASTQVAVTVGATTPNVNFALAQGGFISGRITDAATGNGVAGASISVSGISVSTGSSSVTSPTGEYSTTGLPSGTYVIRYNPTQNNNFAGQIYNGIPCAGCSNSDGTPITVTLGSVTPNINMALAHGGHISGVITDAVTGAPLSNIQVDVVNSAGGTFLSTSTNTSGIYTTSTAPVGSYFVKTRMSAFGTNQGYVNEVFNDITCIGCNPTLGTPVAVTVDATTPNINFALARGSRISGTVTDGAAPLAGQSVQIYTAAGQFIGTAPSTDAAGAFRNLEGLTPGTYYARVGGSNGYFGQLYGGANCYTSCAPTAGTPITVSAGSDTTGVNFALQLGGRISGTVNDAGTGAAIPGVSVTIYNSAGLAVAGGGVTSGGTFLTGALQAGTYRAITNNSLGYINQSFGGGDYLGTDVATTGTPIDVVLGATTSGVAFTLSRGARISGTITGAGGAPLRNVTVEFWTAPFTRRVALATTNVLGQYTSASGLAAGNYTVVTTNNLGYVNEIWNGSVGSNIACVLDCNPGSGAAVAVAGTATTSGIDFALDLDADNDGDGINNTIDKNLGTGADEASVASNDFSDTQIGGLTAGTIADRGGFSVAVLDLSSAGVRATATGSGSSDVRMIVCAVGAAEEVRLRAANDSAVITCRATTGSTNAFALVAATTIELRKTIDGITTIVEIGQNQGATLGSPAAADAGNTESIVVRIVSAVTGEELGSYTLDAGESAEATADAQGNVTIEVVSGAVTATVRGETVTIGEGEAQVFENPITTVTPGRMHGQGVVKDGDDYHFTFHVQQGQTGGENNRFSMNVNHGKQKNKFDSTLVDSIVFTGDAVVFSGVGQWNGAPNCTFEVRTADLGEPGKGRESVSIVIKDAAGQTVASVSGVLTSGNIQKVK